jgi:hypothetical protein
MGHSSFIINNNDNDNSVKEIELRIATEEMETQRDWAHLLM